ncbi:MAG: hypothetical protein KA780_03865, partial [Prolixibacteraceae bacterium]|nr:hypothetical protein [Prolixibacteraceae bacterium]
MKTICQALLLLMCVTGSLVRSSGQGLNTLGIAMPERLVVTSINGSHASDHPLPLVSFRIGKTLYTS